MTLQSTVAYKEAVWSSSIEIKIIMYEWNESDNVLITLTFHIMYILLISCTALMPSFALIISPHMGRVASAKAKTESIHQTFIPKWEKTHIRFVPWQSLQLFLFLFLTLTLSTFSPLLFRAIVTPLICPSPGFLKSWLHSYFVNFVKHCLLSTFISTNKLQPKN